MAATATTAAVGLDAFGLGSAELTNEEARLLYLRQLNEIPKTMDPTAALRQQAIENIEMREAAKAMVRRRMADRAAAAELEKTDPIRTAEEVLEEIRISTGKEGDELYRHAFESASRSREALNKELLDAPLEQK